MKAVFLGWTIVLAVLQISFDGNSNAIAMAAAVDVEGPEWQLVEMNGIPVSSLASEKKPFLKFDAGKKR